MQLTSDHNKEIRFYFQKAQTLEDLVDLFNRVQKMEAEANPAWKQEVKLITVKALKFYLYGKKERYKTFQIPKKSGSMRTIKAPDRFLKMIQRLLNYCLQSLYTPGPAATGFVPKRSVVTNAQHHTGKKYVYNIDLEDFFPSISFSRIWAVLSKVDKFKLHNEVARIVASLCCEDKCLPQGAPTSPTLSNFVCIRLDRKLYELAKKVGFIYSRYADDITISCDLDIFTEDFKNQIFEIIQKEGFELNLKKERLQRYNVEEDGKLIRERQEVTGIIVNEKTNVPRHYIRNLKAALYNWEKRGYRFASRQYEYFYSREKGFIRYNGEIPPFENFVAGKLEYLGMVRGKEDPTYRLLKLKFDSLCIMEKLTGDQLLEILELWQEKGIKKAMDRFYNRKNLTLENG